MKFNPHNKPVDKLTYIDICAPAMEITTKTEAAAYLAGYVDSIMTNKGISVEEATSIAKSNLSYYAGYYDSEVRRRVERLFECKHPVFGSIEELGLPTHEESLELGINMGRGKGPQTLMELRRIKQLNHSNQLSNGKE